MSQQDVWDGFCFKSVVQDIIVLTKKLKESLDSTYKNLV